MEKMLCMGIIVGVKGLKGEVKIKSFTESPLSIKDYKLYDKMNNAYTIIGAYIHKGSVIAKIQHINNVNEALELKGMELYALPAELPKNLETDEFWYGALVGLKVINADKQELGTICSVYNFGAGDIIEIKSFTNQSFMVRFTKEEVPEINLEAGYIMVNRLNYYQDEALIK